MSNSRATRVLMAHGLAESALAALTPDLMKQDENASLALVARDTHLELTLSVLRPSADEARVAVDALATKVSEALGPHVFSRDGEALEVVLGRMLTDAQTRVAVAESCTGGRVAARLTAVPGASAYFLGGVLTYSDELKQKLLGVPPFVLKKAGAVSKDTALAMAVGLARLVECDLALAVTGLAGPDGGSADKPVGLVHLALAMPKGVAHQEINFGPGPRETIQARATQCALWLIYCVLAELDPADFVTDRAIQPVAWRT